MFKNGKVFGKINIIDLSVILLVVFLIFAAYLKFGVLDNTKTTNEMNKIEYTILIEDVRIYATESFKENDILYDSLTGTNIGVIKKMESSIHRENVTKINGERAYTEVPDKYDIKLTIETDGIENETGYFANRSIELKVGSEKKVETKYALSFGTITSINCKKGE